MLPDTIKNNPYNGEDYKLYVANLSGISKKKELQQ